MTPPENAARRRLSMWAYRGGPVWRRLRLLAAMAVMTWGLVLLASIGWAAWLTGALIAAASFALGEPGMTTDTPTTSAACVCGHASAHHTKRDSVYAGLMADYRVVWRCSWKGCGCPEYVEVKP